MMNKLIKPLIYIGLALGMLSLVSFLVSKNPVPTNETTLNATSSHSSVKLPDSINFAGEIVPNNQLEVREALDREMLINSYWHSQTILLIKRANRYLPVIDSILITYGIPPDFRYIPVIESNLLNTIVSPAQAAGFWQFLTPTAQEYGLICNTEVDERYNIEKATEAAAKYINNAYNKLGSWTLAAAAYNAGIKRIETALNEQNQTSFYNLWLNDETNRYIYRLLAVKIIMENQAIYGFNVESDEVYPRMAIKKIKVNTGIPDLIKFSEEVGVNYKTLKYYNPWLRDNQLSNSQNKEFYLSIPIQ